MFERILVALDGSKPAEMVIPYAEEIATKLGSRMILVSVSESIAGDTEHLYRSYLGPITEQVERELSGWGAREVKVENKILLGKPAEEILRYADQSNVSLIAMTSRGSSVKGPWLLGNIASKVLRASSRPVLLARAPVGKEALQQKSLVKRILVPLDGSRVGEAAIPSSEALARAFGAELVLFRVTEPVTASGGEYYKPQQIKATEAADLAYLDDVGKHLKKGLSISSVVVVGSPEEKILDYAQANAIDLIAMSTHGRTGIGRWVFGSVTDKVLHSGDTPVLVVRTPKA